MPFNAIWQRPSGRKVPWDAVLVSVLFHVILLVGAGYLTIIVVQARQKVMFEGRKTPGVPARRLEHAIRVKQMEKQVRKPQILQRLVAESGGKIALPEIPEMQAPDMRNLHDPILSSAKAGSGLGGLGGSGGGAGRGLTGGGGYSDARFFGENVRTRAVCILMDVSQSVVKKGILEDVRLESMELLKSLNPGTRFNVIVFVDGAESFGPQMVFATAENKEKALAWLGQDFVASRKGNRKGYSGSTPSEAIRVATEMGCDTMFVLTDDPPYLKEGTAETGIEIEDHPEQILDYAKDIESTQGRHVTIHTICYKPWDNEKGERAKAFLKKLASATGGRYRLIKRK